MQRLRAVASYTLKQQLRRRLFLLLLLFGLILAASSMVVSALANDERLRAALDIGLASIEFISLLACVFISAGLVLDEAESRFMYLLLSRPVPRWQYLAGRYAGMLAALALGIAIMSGLHLTVLKLAGWTFHPLYLAAVACCFLKIAVVGALALLLSLATTSGASAMAFTLFLWVLGHFSAELRFLAERSHAPLIKALALATRLAVPDFAYFNLRDFWEAARPVPAAFFGWLLAYACAYAAAALAFASWLFSEREL